VTLEFTTLLRTDDVHVVDVRCSCPAGAVEEETTPGFEVVFPTSGMFRRDGVDIDAASTYVGRPGVEQRVEHVTAGDRCVAVLVNDRLADELALDRRSIVRTARHDHVVARSRRGVGEETWLDVLSADSDGPRPASAAHRAAVSRVREAIAGEPGAPWTMRALATVAGYGPHHLSRVFRACTGTTVSAHRDRVRLAQAAELAADGMPLADVAAACGFADHGHLTRRARAVLGTVPSRLRA
jgi:AraC-like DNA-binding protein